MENKKHNWRSVLKNKLEFFIMIMFLAASDSFSQTAVSGRAGEFPIIKESNSILTLEFRADREIQNLLVTVSDSLGLTLFMDNQVHFKGQYKNSVDLKKQGKGNYSVDITRDAEYSSTKIRIH